MSVDDAKKKKIYLFLRGRKGKCIDDVMECNNLKKLTQIFR